MRILACDPGYDRLGIAVLERKDGTDTLLYSDCITTNRTDAASERLSDIARTFRTLIDTHRPTHVVLEKLFFSKNVRTALLVAEARGVLLSVATESGCAVVEYTPQEVKVAVTGYGRSDKTHVASMVRRLLRNVPDRALDDEYDAIAIGLTALASLRTHIPTLR